MNFKKTMFALAVGSVGIMGAMSAHASGNVFEYISGGNGGSSAPAGSWFSMLASDTNGDYIPDANVYVGIKNVNPTPTNLAYPVSNGFLNFDVTNTITPGSGGGTNTASSHNSGNMIDRDWNFFGSWGAHFTTGALEISGSGNTRSVNMSDWRVTWNGIPAINMGGGSPGVLNNVDGIWGNGNDTLDYMAFVPAGDPSNFGGVQYNLHLVGSMTLAPVPEASTYGMMLAGLGLVGFAVRRRKQAI